MVQRNDQDEIRRSALPLAVPEDLDPLLERIGDARYVLIGEASHGTHDFYAWRAALTRRLITEKDFRFVGVEGDWPDCHRIHRAVTGTDGESPREAVYGFARWPSFMWANEEVAEFCRWLRGWNDSVPTWARCGFHGLDVYSLWDSLRAVRGYALRHLPEQADAVLRALHCFEARGHDPQQYGLATPLLPESCEEEAVDLLTTVRRTATDDEAGFSVRQNAEVVAGAEEYYRAVLRGGPESWNVRDTHMADTLDRLTGFYGDDAKAVVWAHNTHIGDARATDMAAAGMTTLGQLVRERHGGGAAGRTTGGTGGTGGTTDRADRADESGGASDAASDAASGSDGAVVLVGFGTHRGTVVAGDGWGAPAEIMPVPPARPTSLESLLHEAAPEGALFVVPPPGDRPGWYDRPVGHRAIGVVYHPERDHLRNYVRTAPGRRYDAFLWLDRTSALHPLHDEPSGEGEPETFPSAQ
ncbi:erythromycin esterase family protein [Planomonospora sp. ID82291]|uniref:erythromycin esterase family protein n=1 Tax=Planomonospora sp. ID82291 TaxID=2738136 RepID=UPI0018C3BC78|nr:erythromycin esterase family protein [Planomonospora sp. ID82291]MBG0815673.1 erythromycin esterase family protein [Planomonospora sp. ID82291]